MSKPAIIFPAIQGTVSQKIHFSRQEIRSLCEIRPISAMVGSIGNYVAERHRTRQKRKQYEAMKEAVDAEYSELENQAYIHFQELTKQLEYDRFSRNMREYLNIMDELDRYGVTVYSLSEPFNTETKEGRMMRNNLLNFAEFERETIAARVADAFQTKARETGFYQGGKVQFGYTPERRTINGKTGSVLVPSENAEAVRVSYDLYQHSENSLTDVIRYLTENGINASRPTPRTKTGISNLDRSHLSRILENPLYVRADKDVYRYFLFKGYEMLDDIEAYDGVHGLFVHAGGDDTYFVKVAYHEWLVDGDVWLRVQDWKAHQNKFPNNGKAMNSWLVGMVKCACCGYAMHFNHCANRKGVVYYRFIDYGKFTLNGCPTLPIQIKPKQVEETVLKEMRKLIEQLHIEKHEASKPDAETESIKTEIIRIDSEIQKLMEKLADADSVLFDYIQKRDCITRTEVGA